MSCAFDRWLALAIYASAGSILVFAHGFAAAGSQFTAVFIAASTLALLLLSRWSDFTIDICDLLFAIFLCCVAASFALNGKYADTKEIVLLAFTLSAYPAARLFAGGKAVAPSFLLFTGAIVAVGATVTVQALIDQWSARHGKPLIFDEFDAAPAQFASSLGILAIALICTDLISRRTRIVSVTMLAAPAAIFAASVVRMPFIAILVALGASTLTARTRQEHAMVAIAICTILFGVIAGNVVRSDTTLKFARYVLAAAPEVTTGVVTAARAASAGPQPGPSVAQAGAPACPAVDIDNSVAIRKQLYAEALALVPTAGLFGIGLDRFMTSSCIRNTEIHNTLLQATVEFGWIAGAALSAIFIVAIASLWPFVWSNSEVRFAFCGLIFVGSLAMGSGRVSRDSLVFLFLGYAAGMRGLLFRSNADKKS